MISELYDEEIDDAQLPGQLLQVVAVPPPEDDDGAVAWVEQLDAAVATVEPWQVRSMLVRYRQLEAEQEQVAKVFASVADSYKSKLSGLGDQMDQLRTAMQSVLERGGLGSKLSFPDAGRINLSTAGGNLTLQPQGGKELAVTEYGFRFERPVVDEAAMNQWAREYHKETGEVPNGYMVQPKRKTLVIAKP
jgi:hypothetical protein